MAGSPKTLPRRLQDAPRRFKDSPRRLTVPRDALNPPPPTLHDAPPTAPRHAQEAPRPSQCPQEPDQTLPQTSQDPPRPPQGPPETPKMTILESVLGVDLDRDRDRHSIYQSTNQLHRHLGTLWRLLAASVPNSFFAHSRDKLQQKRMRVLQQWTFADCCFRSLPQMTAFRTLTRAFTQQTQSPTPTA